ncbi:ribosome silencing factor [Tumebacillus permanentifrigoris]|uniref:Ribosomal silencing factor RsfS n=1 Tax=Tumebacillus permanentifrigoris TaxID=378543 RepID=A0A316DEN4_9BACL|nr:ribosome silencing factor [Tumebacillus permanentifrigoris]PWK16022.1 ribosome-associated protein [Tumebacillus permanentifrigoris]
MRERVLELARFAADAAADKKANDVVLLDIANLSALADYFIICSGNSNTQVQAIANGVVEKMEKRGVYKKSMEGYDEARWVLVDFGDVVIHVFRAEEREFYNLERVWGDAPQLSVV